MRDENHSSDLGSIVLGVCIIIAAFLLYLAWQNHTNNTFDSDRYNLIKVGPDGAASYAAWKLDKRTGYIEFCTRTNDPARQLICIQPIKIEDTSAGSSEIYRDSGAAAQPVPAAPAPAPDAAAAPVGTDASPFKQP